ncbi:MAG: hypothetical protein OXB88_06205 [Bacteriovoracales bacterium]|nr:hypothetical protein [Bacteriovoracales bacterium]
MDLIVKKKKSNAKEEFSIGNHISYSLKGLYRIEHIETLSLMGSLDKYYVLSHAYNKTIHKTFAPVKNARELGMRPLTTIKTFDELKKIVQELELIPEEITNNSNKKMKSYEMRIKERGFTEMIHAFFCVYHDIKISKREDKRYIQFLERLKILICEEMSLTTGENLDTCKEYFESMTKKYQSQ